MFAQAFYFLLFTFYFLPFTSMSWLRSNWRVLLRVPVLVGSALLLFGLIALVRSFAPALVPLTTVELNVPEVTTQRRTVELTLYETDSLKKPLNVELELATDPVHQYTTILGSVRDNLPGVWPEDLPLPHIFVLENDARDITLHFRYEESLAVSVIDEVRIYNSILTTLKANGANQVHLLVNDTSDTFLGHLSLDNALD
jgi:ABC-type transport system involved in multi-copper enzyme maturation permease subunit